MNHRSGSEGDIVLFDAVVRGGTFAAAARELGVTPGAISRRIKALETRLGARLVSRTTRSLTLTEAGARYAERCARIVADIVEAENAASDDTNAPGGLLRIGASASLWDYVLLPQLTGFLEAHPSIVLDMVTGGRNLSLINDKLDALVMTRPPVDISVVGVRLFDTPWVTCAAPGYVREHGEPRTPGDLTGHACLAPRNLAGDRITRWAYRTPQGTQHVDVRPRMTGLSIHLLPLARQGFGIARIPAHLARQDLEAGTLVTLLPDYPDADARSVFLHCPRLPRRPRRASRAIDTLLQAYGLTLDALN